MHPGSLSGDVGDRVRTCLEERVGGHVEIRGVEPVRGGSINRTERLRTDRGDFFLKVNSEAPAGFFEAEVEGLDAIRAAGAVRVPEVIGTGRSDRGADAGTAWLVLEFVERGSPGPGYGLRLGRAVAALHDSADTSATTTTSPDDPVPFGWPEDNFIGSLPQSNGEFDDWGRFWLERRIAPQVERAGAVGRLGPDEAERVLHAAWAASESVEVAGCSPALLHGDLWSGNVFCDGAGAPVLVDPAIYRGAGEVDLAMAALFGGFPADFLEGYRSARRVAPWFEEWGRALWQLYPLLVHLNLFGGSYRSGVLGAARTVNEALRV